MSTILQSGTVTPGHVATWTISGVLQDGGTAAAPYINALGVYGSGGTPFTITNSSYPGSQSGSPATVGMGVTSTTAYTTVNNAGTYQVTINGVTSLSLTQAGTLSLAAALPVTSGGTGVTSSTGTGSNVLSNNGTLTSAVLVTPVLGGVTLPASGVLLSSVTAPASNPVTGTPSASTFFRGDGTWALAPGTGTVTSIQVSGGSTGLTTSGGPVSTSGTITLSGTLAVANGGTGATTSTGSGAVVLSTSPAITGDMSVSGTMVMGSSFLRNRLINGSMQIAQYGTSASLANGAVGYVCCDRWLVQNNLGSAASVSQYGSSYYGGVSSLSIYVSATVPTSSAAYMFQRIESQNIADLVGQTVTLSFYAAATATGGTLSANITVSYPSALDNWTSFTTPINLSFSITSSPTRFTKTFTLPSQCTNGAQISITASNTGSSASLFSMNIGAVQLEAGAVATPFEQQPIGQILALCQRYYEVLGMFQQSPVTGDVTCLIPFKVSKRAATTNTISSITYSNASGLSDITATSINGTTGVVVKFNVSSATGLAKATITSSAEL